MKTINTKSALVASFVIAFLTFATSANAQWKSERDDKTFREKIEEKIAKERADKRYEDRNDRDDDRWERRDGRYERRDVRWDHRDVKYNNGRFNKRNPYYRHDCDNKKFAKKHKCKCHHKH